MALGTVHLKSFHSIPLCCALNLSKNISFQPSDNSRSKSIGLDKILGPKNKEHASLPVLNGSAPHGAKRKDENSFP